MSTKKTKLKIGRKLKNKEETELVFYSQFYNVSGLLKTEGNIIYDYTIVI